MLNLHQMELVIQNRFHVIVAAKLYQRVKCASVLMIQNNSVIITYPVAFLLRVTVMFWLLITLITSFMLLKSPKQAVSLLWANINYFQFDSVPGIVRISVF